MSDKQEPGLDSGNAGASARREYERRKTKRATRILNRFGRRVGGAVLAFTNEPQSTRAWAEGAAGERDLAEALAKVEGIRALHDRRMPGTRANIDHIVVAPAGVFVIDAKRYEGLIRIRGVGGLLKHEQRLYVGGRDCSKLAAHMGWQVETVAGALGAARLDPTPPIIPVLCFVHGQWPLLTARHSYAGVRLEGERSIGRLFTKNQLLDAATIKRIAVILASALPSQ